MTKSGRGVSVLAVDDSEATLELVDRILRSEGYVVYTAPRAVEAIDFLETQSVDLVITDLRMPGGGRIDARPPRARPLSGHGGRRHHGLRVD
ncbi:MAG: response regulator [Deltaproteobacteria bacterium]|nr:response regulator [Deltaproteobacteria bacterium]